MVSRIFVVWMCLSAVTATRQMILQPDGRSDIWCPLILAVADALLWTGFTFALFWLADRISLEKMTWRSLLLIVPVLLARLSELLRLSLTTMRQRVVPLANELEVIGRYVEIQRVRFADILNVELAVADNCLGALVPPFLLQPLVENAIKHGVLQSNGRCDIRLGAWREGVDLRIRIENSGSMIADPVVEHVGLTNTRDRLRAAYGERASLTIEGVPPLEELALV